MANSLLMLLDDIATMLDDISVMTKVAARKTAGVLGDDLALNAQQVTGVRADREIPVVLSVAKGSFINKLILVPVALIISVVAPWLITPLLMVGGAFLCYEGAEKIIHKLMHKKGEDSEQALLDAIHNPEIDLVKYEKDKIKGAIRTDFILSAEIIVISLGTVAAATFPEKVLVLSIIAVVMTIGVYGLVAGIVKLDDFGLYLSKKSHAIAQTIGDFFLKITPYLMRALGVIGTIAMFMVGGGILSHGITFVDSTIDEISELALVIPDVGVVVSGLMETLLNMVFGIIAGVIVYLVVTLISKLRTKNA